MDGHLETLAAEYRRHYGTKKRSGQQELNVLYKSFVKDREGSLLDVAAEALTMEMFRNKDQLDHQAITPQHEEAYKLAFSTQSETLTLAERYEELSSESDKEVTGFISNLKGKYFEVIVRDKLNAGERVGECLDDAFEGDAVVREIPSNDKIRAWPLDDAAVDSIRMVLDDSP